MTINSIVKPVWLVALSAALGISAARSATAADIRFGVSARETYVGLPVTLQIQIVNATDYEQPEMPEVDGLTIKSLGAPSTLTKSTIINGRASTSKTVTFEFQITPRREDTFTVPPITVRVDGREQRTEEFQFVASKSETGDLLFVEVAGKQDHIYVGQSLDLTLKIWLRPYRDKERGLTLSAADMWRMISDQTSWGPFAEQIENLSARQQPLGQEVLREDSNGVKRSYYLYEIDATVYPQRPGKIDAKDVQVVVQYPTALGTSRDPFAGFFNDVQMPVPRSSLFDDDFFSFSPFGSRLAVQSVRPIVADAAVEPIDVLPIPTAGCPDDYRGAVGKYRIVTEAKPTTVKAGDPINLLIGIVGTGPMELVQAPPLADLSDVLADFKVPNEPLAGFVEGEQKVFSTSIRPRREGISEIPAIPFSYFDPETEEFITVRSEPISVHVEPADTLQLNAIVGVGATGPAGPEKTNHTSSVAESLSLANFSSGDILENEPRQTVTTKMLPILLAMPPLLVLLMQIVRGRRAAFALVCQFRSSFRQCETGIARAQQPAEIAAVLRTLLMRRFRLSEATTDISTAIGVLRTAGYRDLAIGFERIFNQCEKADHGGGLGCELSLTQLKSESLEAVHELENRRRTWPRKPTAASPQPVPSTPNRSPMRSSASLFVGAIAVIELVLGMSASAAATTQPARLLPPMLASETTLPSHTPDVSSPTFALTHDGQRTLLTEANQAYEHAVSASAHDTAEAKQAFSEAAEKYQLIVESGVRNSRLYFNLANAYLQSGQLGRAIANYHRALRIDPTNRRFSANLEYAERIVESASEDAGSRSDRQSWWDDVRFVNVWLNRYVSPRSVLVTLAIAWCALWATFGIRLARVRFPWKSISFVALTIVVATAISYSLSCEVYARSVAVIVSPSVTLREGDGANFPKVAELQQTEGRTVEVVKRRGDWLHIRAETGQAGWLPRQAVEVI